MFLTSVKMSKVYQVQIHVTKFGKAQWLFVSSMVEIHQSLAEL